MHKRKARSSCLKYSKMKKDLFKMLRKNTPILLSAIAFFLTFSVSAGEPENAPTWNKVREAENVPAKISEDNLLWKIDCGTRRQYPMPRIVGDRVLVMGTESSNMEPEWKKAVKRGGSLLCLSLKDGSEIWRLISPGKGRPTSFGICGEPVVEGNRIYVVAMQHVYCLDMNGMADGNQGAQNELQLMGGRGINELPDWSADIIWHYSFGPMNIQVQDAISCSPVSVNGQIWVSTANEMGSEARGTKSRKPHMIVLDKETGKLIATDDMDVPVIWHGEWSSPAVVEAKGEKIVIFGDGYGILHGLKLPSPSPDGNPVKIKEYWTFDLNPREYRYDEQGRRHPYCIDTRLTYKYPMGWLRDAEKWIVPPDEWAKSRKTGKDLESTEGVALEDIKYRSPREETEHPLASPEGPAELIATPAVVGNRIYLGIGRDYNYTGGRDIPEDRKIEKGTEKNRKCALGRFMCLELEDPAKPPRLVWEDRNAIRLQSTASIADGLVYACDLGGFLNCWEAETGKVVYRFDIGASVRERSQLVVDGKIYIINDKHILKVIKAGRQPELISETRLKHESATVDAADGVLCIVSHRDVRLHGSGQD